MDENKKDFLIAEYNHAADSFWQNKHSGEKRVSFFITLGTAVMAALGAMAKVKIEDDGRGISGDDLRIIILCALGSLLLFGIVTFARMMRRHRVRP